MSLVMHFKDGTTAASTAVAAIAYPLEYQLVDGSTPPVVHGYVPVASLDWIEVI